MGKKKKKKRPTSLTPKKERMYEIGYLPAGKEMYGYDTHEELQSNYQRVTVSQNNLVNTVMQITMNSKFRLEYVVLQDT